MAIFSLPLARPTGTPTDVRRFVNVTDRDGSWLPGACLVADIIARDRDAAHARSLYAELAPFRDEWGGVASVNRGPVAYSLAVLAHTFGDLALANEEFASAAEMCERLGAPFFIARTCLAWGRLLMDRDAPGDAERITELASRSCEIAAQYGYAQIERRSRRILEDRGVTAGGHGSGRV